MKFFLILVFISSFTAFADSSLDRKYSLETVGLLRSWDNIDGLFVDYVHEAYANYFSNQSRFSLRDISRSDDVIKQSKLPYEKVIHDKEILAALSKKFKVETLIRTKITKEGPYYRFSLDWLHAPKITVLATYEFKVDEPTAGTSLDEPTIEKHLFKALDTLIGEVPFVGHVSGKSEEWVTVNVGKNIDLKVGDILVVGTINEAKEHPLLHSVVGWGFEEVGRLKVEDIDEKIAFCRITNEKKGNRISRYQKIISVIDNPNAPNPDMNEMVAEAERKNRHNLTHQKPTLGFLQGGVLLGSSNREIGTDSSTGRKGSGILLGAQAYGQLWITREFFVEMGLRAGTVSWDMGPLTGSGTSSSVSATLTEFQTAVGYNYLLSNSFFGPKAWGKIGLRSVSYSMATSTTNLTTPTKFSGLFIGAGTELPIREPWGIVLDVAATLFKSVKESPSISGGSEGGTDVSFFVGGYYQLNWRMVVRGGFGMLSNTGDFSGNTSLTQRSFYFSPSILYYF